MARKKIVGTIIWSVIILLGVDFLVIKIFDFLQIHTTSLISPQLILIVIFDMLLLGIMLEDVIKTLRQKPTQEAVLQETRRLSELVPMILLGKRSEITSANQEPSLDAPVSVNECSVLMKDLPERKEPIVAWGYAVVACLFLFPPSLLLIYLGFYAYLDVKDDPSRWGGAPFGWCGSAVAILFALGIAYMGVIFFRITLGQLKNRTIFNRGSANAQAQLLAHWWGWDEGVGTWVRPTSYFYLKFAFQPIESANYTDPIIVVANVSSRIYRDMMNKELMNIQYANEEPLIVKIEGETTPPPHRFH